MDGKRNFLIWIAMEMYFFSRKSKKERCYNSIIRNGHVIRARFPTPYWNFADVWEQWSEREPSRKVRLLYIASKWEKIGHKYEVFFAHGVKFFAAMAEADLVFICALTLI